MRGLRPFLIVMCLMFMARVVPATTVIAPTFRELVAEARTVFVGQVTGTQAVWVGRDGDRAIFTDVTFTVGSTLNGDALPTRTLRFMGGTLDGYTLTIPGVPHFSAGDRAVLFVSATGPAISPLVGVMHGRFPITQAADGYEYVTLHDGRAFATIAQIGPSAAVVSPTPIRTMRLVDFENEIMVELRARGSR